MAGDLVGNAVGNALGDTAGGKLLSNVASGLAGIAGDALQALATPIIDQAVSQLPASAQDAARNALNDIVATAGGALGGALAGGGSQGVIAGAGAAANNEVYNYQLDPNDPEAQLTGESKSRNPFSRPWWVLVLQGISNGLTAWMPGEAGGPPVGPSMAPAGSGAGQAVNVAPGTLGYAPGNATLNSGDNGNAQGSNGGASTSNTSDLQNAANQPINDSGLSAAARAWDKHAGRPGGTFEPLTGSITDKNAAASEFVNQVLNDPSTTQTNLSRGGVEFRLPNGQGIRFNADGSFSGFLDPRK